MKFFNYVPEGGEFPRWLGRWRCDVAWRDWDRCGTIVAPFPFNILCGQVRKAYHWFLFWNRDRCQSKIDEIKLEAYWNGYARGLRETRQAIERWTGEEKE